MLKHFNRLLCIVYHLSSWFFSRWYFTELRYYLTYMRNAGSTDHSGVFVDPPDISIFIIPVLVLIFTGSFLMLQYTARRKQIFTALVSGTGRMKIFEQVWGRGFFLIHMVGYGFQIVFVLQNRELLEVSPWLLLRWLPDVLFLIGLLGITCFFMNIRVETVQNKHAFKRDLYAAILFLTVMKYLFVAVMMPFVQGYLTSIRLIRNEEFNLPDSLKSEMLDNYGVFPWFRVGEDSDEELTRQISIPDQKININLYPVLNRKGAVYCYPYETKMLPCPILQVNLNYLKVTKILDAAGISAEISEEEKEIIFLSSLPPDQDASIEKAALTRRQGCRELEESYGIFENTMEDTVRIIHLDHPVWCPTFLTGAGEMEAHLIMIVTEENCLLTERPCILGRGLNDPVKVRLEQSPEETYQSIVNILTDLHLDDNLTELQSLRNIIDKKQSEIHQTILFSALVVLSFFAIKLLFDCARISVIYRLNTRYISLYYINGHSLSLAYGGTSAAVFFDALLEAGIACIFHMDLNTLLITWSVTFLACFVSFRFAHQKTRNGLALFLKQMQP